MNNTHIKQMIDWVHEERENGKEPVTWWVGVVAHHTLCKTFSKHQELFDFDSKGISFYDIPIRYNVNLGENVINLETK